MLVEAIHGIPERIPAATTAGAVPVLADVVVLPRRAAALPGEVNTPLLDGAGRFRLAGVIERLGWTPGDLDADLNHCDWVVLRATGTTTRRRGQPRVTAAGRVTLPHALGRRIGVAPGTKAYALEIPDHGALALTHPGHVLTGAPLVLAGATGC